MGEFTGQELIQAAIYDDADLLNCLLEGECAKLIDTTDRKGRTAVYTSVSNNSTKCLRILLDAGANPNIAADAHFHRMTPLHCAVVDLKLEMTRLLLRHGADFTIKDASGQTAMDLASNLDLPEYIDILQQEQDERTKVMRKSMSEFSQACVNEDIKEMKSILAKVQMPNFLSELVNGKVTDDILSPLCLACKSGNTAMVALLLNNDASVRNSGPDDFAPVHYACHFGHPDCLRLLLERWPDVVSMKTATESLPIHIAASAQKLEIIRLLLEFEYPESALVTFEDNDVTFSLPFDLNARDCNDNTAFFIAAERRDINIVRYLILFTCKTEKIQSRQHKGYVPRSRRRSDMMNVFDPLRHEESSTSEKGSSNVQYHPVKLNVRCQGGYTPLYIAVKRSYTDIVDLLLKSGSDVNIHVMDKGHRVSVLMVACQKGESLILDKLLRYGADDFEKTVFRYAVEKQPRMIFTLLRYRTIMDTENEYSINKLAMKMHYLEFMEQPEDFSGLSSLNADFAKKFPIHGVHIKWQDLQHLETVKEDWLMNIGYHHNMEMENTLNSPFALYAITKIDVSGNKLGSTFPSVFYKLPSLHSLNVSKNQISSFSPSKSSKTLFVCLEELLLDHNELESIPSDLCTVSTLRKLSVSKNKLKDIPAEIWDLQSLAYLNLSNNQLKNLPQPKLLRYGHNDPRNSSASSNEFAAVDPETMDPSRKNSELSDVKHVTYWMSHVSVIDHDFDINIYPSRQRGLQDLNLSNNCLSDIPYWFCCSSPYMENLNLSDNKIKSVGKIPCLPQYLKTLDLSHNLIVDTESWQNFEDINPGCFSNRISRTSSSPRLSVDKSPHGFGSITSLGISCTHKQHTILERLDTLNLSENRQFRCLVVAKKIEDTKLLKSVDSSTLGSQDEIKRRLLFPNLTSLDLSHNRSLSQIPATIGDISSLKRLSLAMTNVRELPPEIGRLKNLFTLDIDLCPLEGPIQDIIRSSTMRTRDILGFLLSVLEEAEEYNCMNLMFVGLHNIGKTLLLQQIRKYSKINKPLSHFNQRVDGSVPGNKQDGGTLSTVGIDISEIMIEKKSNGPVMFRTWDFGGQKEYYATHQYFLSPRSLYLVLWKLTDGEQGIQGIWQWLVNIQARAPGAPVIIVGTHRDYLTSRKTKSNYPVSFEDDMKSLIDKYFIYVEEPEKCGLPYVIAQINVSSKTGDKVKELVDIIYKRVFELKHPKRNRERMLQHKVPKKYLILKDIVQEIAEERQREKKDPVLDRSSYVLKTMDKMSERASTLFRDVDDVEQATRFLHENGILFHYEDLALRDFYFLNPQWLCDQLARVVTVDQVNNFAQNGVMKAENLSHLFKKSSFQPENIETYICGLLGKFELALQFDRNHLLIPSLLPREYDMAGCIKKKTDVKIPLPKPKVDHDSSSSSQWTSLTSQVTATPVKLTLLKTSPTSNITFSYCRLYVMTYFPSGFWPQLLTRILADSSLYEIVQDLFPLPETTLEACPTLRAGPIWQPWQTGLQLLYHNTIIFRVKEVLSGSSGFCDYNHSQLQCFLDDAWMDLDMINSVVLEMGFQTDSITFSFAEQTDTAYRFARTHHEKIFLDEKAIARFLAKITEHIDNLLQDWYPEIGESRFVQNCYGRYLVTRIIPCSHCLYSHVKRERSKDASLHWQLVSPDSDEDTIISVSRNSCDMNMNVDKNDVLYCFLVERCILNFLNGHNEICPKHGSVSPTYMMTSDGIGRTIYIAPDVVFNDLENRIIIGPTDSLVLEKHIGKGAFGDVFVGVLRKIEEPPKNVAVKVLFGPFKEVNLNPKGQTHLHIENASVAYLTARQEVSILQRIQHDHLVPLLGLATRPLALVLSLAPLGSLGNILQQFSENGRHLPVFAIKQIVIQVADALSYLHELSIIYRDLKADNVLIWQMNTSDKLYDSLDPVVVKIADYGISRAVLPSGAKGFGGTPPFIAPEILQFAGKNPYTEKVDIFSFGMFMYELLSCRKPLEDVTNPTLYICQNGRPSVTSKEKQYPSHFLDLMCKSWSQEPSKRPSADQVKQIAGSTQFCHLADAISLESKVGILAGCSVNVSIDAATENDHVFDAGHEDFNSNITEVWLSMPSINNNSRIEVYDFDKNLKCTGNKTILMKGFEIDGMVHADGSVWCIDTMAKIHIFCTRDRSESTVQLCAEDVNVPVKVLCAQYLTLHDKKQVIFILKKQSRLGSDTLFLVTIAIDNGRYNPRCLTLDVDGQSMCAAIVQKKEKLELWVGQSEGRIVILDLTNPKKKADILDYFKLENLNRKCTFLETACSKEGTSVWIYNYPGTVVSRWDADSFSMKEELNCSNVVPVSEGSTITTFSRFEARRYQVTAMKVLGKYLYIGTTWGCVIVADALTLLPFTVFRCHSSEDFYVRLILPILRYNDSNSDIDSDGIEVPGVVTIGKGYRDLISNICAPPREQNITTDEEEGWELVQTIYDRSHNSNKTNPTYLLSWLATNWEFY